MGYRPANEDDRAQDVQHSMAIGINSNIASLSAQRRLGESSALLSSTFERLASGQRINKASDDAAGLAIAESLKADTRVYSQAIRNVNDGVSALNIAEGALESLSGIVIRLEELAQQAANGVFGAAQRNSIDNEAQALSSEYARIASSTEFNGIRLLDGSMGDVRLQAGYGDDGSIAAGVGGAIGTGSFGAAISLATETIESQGLAMGDLNGDGFLDLATAGSGASSVGYVTIQLGRGDGSFNTAISYQNEDSLSSGVALGDLNSDGVLDLVSCGGSAAMTGRTTVRLGRGDGTFGAAVSFGGDGSHSWAVALGDMNGDGDLDIVTAGYQPAGGGTVTIQLGNGDGTFRAGLSYDSDPNTSRSLALGDLNTDGALDLVVSGWVTRTFIGTGDGRLTAPGYDVGGLSWGVTLGDVNADGIVDMAAANTGTQANLIRLGNGDGTFGAERMYDVVGITGMITMGDINSDSALDLLTTINGGGFGINVQVGNGDGTFKAAISYLSEAGSVAIGAGDFNSDGVLDVITAGANAGSGEANLRLSITKDGVSPLLPFDLTTMAGARQALPVFKLKLNQLASQRGEIGAVQSRLSVAFNTLSIARENFSSAASRIQDADVAQESANLGRLQILQQAGSAVLGQANQQPALALSLLRG